MIILHIFDQICNTNICHDKTIIEHVYFVQNTIAFIILCISCVYMYKYTVYNDIEGLIPCTNLLLSYLAYDILFIEKPSLYIHHGIVFAMFSFFHQIPGLTIHSIHPIFAALIFTEISSVFLSLVFMQKYIHKYVIYQNWMSHVHTVWKICFLLSFIGFRLIYYPVYTLFNVSFVRLLSEHAEHISDVVQVYILFTGLFVLNLYWTGMILKSYR